MTLTQIPQSAKAGLFGDSETEKALETAQKDVRSLLQISERSELPFHNSRARKLLAFAALDKDKPGELHPEELNGADGAYWEFTLQRSLADVASYIFNSEVPAHAVYPGAVRLGGWHDSGSVAQGLQSLQAQLPDKESPVVVRGVEYEATTPDPNSGTYFRYDLNRLLAGYQDGQTPVIISVSHMKGQSSVGKKGVAFGPPKQWYFFYSGIKGNLLPGVGWAESRMYASVSVFVYSQVAPNTTKASLLKWVKAGWKGMNMVKRKHILKGLKDFGKNLRALLASSSLPSPEDIASRTEAIAAMDEEQMRKKLAPLQTLLQESVSGNDDLQRGEFKELIQEGYLQSLTREELAAELVKGYMREAVQR